MLALTRRQGESILIHPSDSIAPDMTVTELFKDGSIKIFVSAIQNGQVRIGIDAPDELAIVREELKIHPV